MESRFVQCFTIEKNEETALAVLDKLHGSGGDDFKVRCFTKALYRLDTRLIDWQPLTNALTGANKSDHVRANRIFTTEAQLVKMLRQWSHKSKPDSLDHSEATRASHVAGMLTQVKSRSQRTAKMNGYNINARYVINDYGRAYLSWLERRAYEHHAAEDELYRETCVGQGASHG